MCSWSYDTVKNWAVTLSGGQKQRVAMVSFVFVSVNLFCACTLQVCLCFFFVLFCCSFVVCFSLSFVVCNFVCLFVWHVHSLFCFWCFDA